MHLHWRRSIIKSDWHPLTLHLSLMAVTAAAVVVCTATHARSQTDLRPGYVPNELVESLVDLPLREAETVFDVYQIIVDLLQETYPPDGKAAEALAEMERFLQPHIANARQGLPASTVEMPFPIDEFMRTLRENAPVGDTSKYATSNVKAKLYTAMCLLFLQCRGITYRVRPMIEESYLLHTNSISALRSLKQRLNAGAGPNGVAVFEFLTYPMAHKGDDPIQFRRPSDVQEWLERHMIPTLDVAIAFACDARKQMRDEQQESIDLSLFLDATDPFPNPEMRTAHRFFSTPEVEHFISKLYRWRATLRLVCAYRLDDLPPAIEDIRQARTRDFFGDLALSGTQPRIGITSRVVFQALGSYRRLFTLRNAAHCRAALLDFQEAWSWFDRAMRGYFAAQSGRRSDRLVNLRWVHATQDEYFNKIGPEMQAVLNGRASLQDYIGGAVVDIDVPALLTDPPQDLKDFFPSKFSEGAPFRDLKFSSGSLRYTNYDYGNAVGWQLDRASRSWQKLFPNIDMRPGPQGLWDAPVRAHRDLSRTYAGNVLAPLVWMMIH